MKLMPDNELMSWTKKVSTRFYELVFEDPWFSKIFRNVDQEIITSQQADFMTGALGGPKLFGGRMPKDAHPHIWVDEKIWEYRENLLKQTFEELYVPLDLREKWLAIDNAFKRSILNTGDKSECFGRYKTDEIIYEPMPEYLKKKKAS
ncbi:MAG: hypothetical protein CME65_02410 [Halobacteriovoraceae bacterium]|nr:hypothetical protein [Halobacteriovoraceae bacterium]|tara:strand:- start:6942 stop:7385 length:444 start_codon:yes stop_codon:yes gene_type:complete